MIERYASKEINEIWSDENKLKLWQETELAVIEAMAEIEQIDKEVYQKISKILKSQPIDVNWWKAKDAEIKHDLNAFVEERLHFLPPELQQLPRSEVVSIKDIIAKGDLRTSPELEATEEDVKRWNDILKQIFGNLDNVVKWNRIFRPSYLLRNEAKLYQEIIGA
jgi:hypothetical protein